LAQTGLYKCITRFDKTLESLVHVIICETEEKRVIRSKLLWAKAEKNLVVDNDVETQHLAQSVVAHYFTTSQIYAARHHSDRSIPQRKLMGLA